MIKSYIIELKTDNSQEIINISDKVKDIVKESGVKRGVAIVSTKHTTTSICVNEECKNLQNDVLKFLSNLVGDFNPTHDHKTLDSRPNGRGHLIAHLLPHSECLSIEDGELNIGKWQTVFFIELDGPRDVRKIEVKIIGDV